MEHIGLFWAGFWIASGIFASLILAAISTGILAAMFKTFAFNKGMKRKVI